MFCTLRVPILFFTQTFRTKHWLVVYAVVVGNLNVFDLGERFPCVIRRLITGPSNAPLVIGGIRDVMSDCVVNDIFILVFHCDVQRHDIRGAVIEGFEMSDVSYALVLSDEVTDCVNIFFISPLDVGCFIRSLPPGTVLVGGAFPALVGG